MSGIERMVKVSGFNFTPMENPVSSWLVLALVQHSKQAPQEA